MNILFILEILFFSMAVLSTLLFIATVFFGKSEEPDYEALYRMMVEQEEENLKTLNIKNKEIEKIEEKILICKKKLGWKLFKEKKDD